MIDLVDAPSTASARERVASLMSRLPAANAWAVLEHQFGVRPLIDAFFSPQGAIAEVESGRKLGALGLFTPTPEPGWGAAAVAAESAGDGLLLRGEVRLPSPAAEGSIVLVRLANADDRLAWLDHGAPGVERRGSRTGGLVDGGPCWLHIERARVGPELVSRPVTLIPDGEFWRRLAAYSAVWALAAAICAREGVRALRRAARSTAHQGQAFNSSQWVALGITGVEIEADLTAAAAQRHLALSPEERTGGLALAVAAARTLSAVAAKTEELRGAMGLEIDGPLTEGAAKTLAAFLGGALTLEEELARAMGIRDLPPQETNR
jgi:hypothetical protein